MSLAGEADRGDTRERRSRAVGLRLLACLSIACLILLMTCCQACGNDQRIEILPPVLLPLDRPVGIPVWSGQGQGLLLSSVNPTAVVEGEPQSVIIHTRSGVKKTIRKPQRYELLAVMEPWTRWGTTVGTFTGLPPGPPLRGCWLHGTEIVSARVDTTSGTTVITVGEDVVAHLDGYLLTLACSGETGRIAVGVFTEGLWTRVIVLDPTGGILAEFETSSAPTCVEWSPDGSQLAARIGPVFPAPRPSNPTRPAYIMATNLQGPPEPVPNSEGALDCPAWSDEGHRMAWVRPSSEEGIGCKSKEVIVSDGADNWTSLVPDLPILNARLYGLPSGGFLGILDDDGTPRICRFGGGLDTRCLDTGTDTIYAFDAVEVGDRIRVAVVRTTRASHGLDWLLSVHEIPAT